MTVADTVREASGRVDVEVDALVTVPRAEVHAQLRCMHDGALQEVATLRVALGVWARAADRGDLATSRDMLPVLRDASDRLLNDLEALQDAIQGWLTRR